MSRMFWIPVDPEDIGAAPAVHTHTAAEITDLGTAQATVIEAGTVESDGTVLWRWGIDADTGQPYFDTAGADVGEEAAVTFDTGRFYIEEVAL